MESVFTFQEPEGREGIKGSLDEIQVDHGGLTLGFVDFDLV